MHGGSIQVQIWLTQMVVLAAERTSTEQATTKGDICASHPRIVRAYVKQRKHGILSISSAAGRME